jgi:hypothetical protein
MTGRWLRKAAERRLATTVQIVQKGGCLPEGAGVLDVLDVLDGSRVCAVADAARSFGRFGRFGRSPPISASGDCGGHAMSGEWRRRAAELKAVAAARKTEKSQDSSGAAEFDHSPPVFAADRMAESASADRPDASAAADAFEERAAAVEFDAGIPRAWAEGFAALHQAKAPAWTARHPDLWAELVTAVGLFLDRWGRQAAELGWDPVDLFGASPRAPLARVDQQGLLFFLQDDCEIVAMTADTATIRRPSGVVQTFRKPHKNAREPHTAPIWELVADGGGKP